MHQPKPWFRASKNAWYVQIGRRQVSLGKDEAEAHRRFYRLMAEEGLDQARRPAADIQVAVLCDLYLDHSRRHHAPATYEWYRAYLQDFCDRYGGLGVAALRPLHVTRWLEAHGWGQSTRRGAIAIIKRVLSYALAEGYIREDPLRSLKKPPMRRREKILSAEERRALLDATPDQPFRDFLTALQETGARPGEVFSVTAADVDLEEGLWILLAHKARAKTGKARVIYLTPRMVDLCRRLVAAHPTGPLFRNTDGKPWNRNAVRCRFRRLRRKLGLDAGVVAYAFRHSWATDALEKGVPIATVAELLGHSDTKMVSAHYSHLHERREHLRAAARSIRPGGS
jgi:integrase